MSRDWYDEFFVGASRHLARMLDGSTIVVTGDPELGQQAETRLCVERVIGALIGVDSNGLFAGVDVEASVGPHLAGANPLARWTLYTDGRVTDADDRTIGTHTLATGVGNVLEGVR